MLEARPPNWLPLPGVVPRSAAKAPIVEENDLFPKGDVESFYPRQGYGYVKNSRGESLLFRLSELTLVGPKNDPKYLTEGCRVGFDVSCTSTGPHISRLKIY